MKTKLKIVALLSYCFIILNGHFIGIPLIFWLVFSGFDINDSNQFYAVMGLIGIILMFTQYYKRPSIRTTVLLLMLTPIVKQLITFPWYRFSYSTFIIPLIIFIISSLILI